MLWLLLGCASHRTELPLAAAHSGPTVEPPRTPLVSVWIDAADDSCADVADGLRFAWTAHADQIILPDAAVHLTLQNCSITLSERVRMDPQRSLSGEETLDALLTGHGLATVSITRDGVVLEVREVEALEIVREEWTGGQRYAWRPSLTAAVEWSLAEALEAELLPLSSLRAPRPAQRAVMAAGAAADVHSPQSPASAPPLAPIGDSIAMQEPD